MKLKTARMVVICILLAALATAIAGVFTNQIIFFYFVLGIVILAFAFSLIFMRCPSCRRYIKFNKSAGRCPYCGFDMHGTLGGNTNQSIQDRINSSFKDN